MEDMFCVAFQPTPDDKDLEYAFFGIFDGHGGGEAATFAKEHLMDIIVKQKNFWSDRDEDVLRAIRDGYMNTHYAMWRELGTEIHTIVLCRRPARSRAYGRRYLWRSCSNFKFAVDNTAYGLPRRRWPPSRISVIVPRISPTTVAATAVATRPD